MPVYKNKKDGTWYVKVIYKDANGTPRSTTKRGFRLKNEAVAWERQYYVGLSSVANTTFAEFCEIYKKEHFPRLKENTATSLGHVLDNKLIPAFGNLQLKDITPKVVILWQNKLKKDAVADGKSLKNTYINKLTECLGAVLGYACKFYDLPDNPVLSIDKLSEVGVSQMKFWTADEYASFAEAFEPASLMRTSFDTLYWSGIREGELMALTWEDIDLKKGIVSISKTMHLRGGTPIITPPKTQKSNRRVKIPKKLCEELIAYKARWPDITPETQTFPVSPSILHRKMKEGCKKTGMKPIRVHDLRHSHVSLLIHLGFSAVDIAERMGHESTDITLHYAHLFPSEQDRIARELDVLRKQNKASLEANNQL